MPVFLNKRLSTRYYTFINTPMRTLIFKQRCSEARNALSGLSTHCRPAGCWAGERFVKSRKAASAKKDVTLAKKKKSVKIPGDTRRRDHS